MPLLSGQRHTFDFNVWVEWRNNLIQRQSVLHPANVEANPAIQSLSHNPHMWAVLVAVSSFHSRTPRTHIWLKWDSNCAMVILSCNSSGINLTTFRQRNILIFHPLNCRNPAPRVRTIICSVLYIRLVLLCDYVYYAFSFWRSWNKTS